jgi:membrane protein DedA with SNARE-associated domain
LIARWPALGQQRDRVDAMLHRFHAAVVIGVRFAYGLRIAGPVLIGTTTITALRFALLNAIGALLWALVIAGLGWAFGSAAEALLGQLQHFEAWFLAGVAVLAALIWWIRRRKQRKG